MGVNIHPEEDTSFTKMLEYGLTKYMDRYVANKWEEKDRNRINKCQIRTGLHINDTFLDS